jgi:hypothetical protein
MFPTLKVVLFSGLPHSIFYSVVLIRYSIPFFSRPAYKKDYNVSLLPN